jgi:hypothetical protein
VTGIRTALTLLGVAARFVRFPQEDCELPRAGKPTSRLRRFAA